MLFDDSSILKFESVHLEGQHLRQLDNPFCFCGIALCCLIHLITLNRVLESTFPSLIEVFFVRNLKHDIAKSFRTISLNLVALFILEMQKLFYFSNES